VKDNKSYTNIIGRAYDLYKVFVEQKISIEEKKEEIF